ncbi:MAG: chromate transporter [Pontiellaceae bacterium]|nr:chromate transporter [Pontiellaceae bacterium]MBN2785069.1 chromate transporter [Pontiellaceae bacterium]
MNVFFQLLTSFSAIGIFAFGGGYAVLSFLQHEVERRGWMTTERFADLIAISQSTPGPIAINLATFVGFETGGVAGAVLATVAVALPGMILMILFARFFFHFYDRPNAQALFKGLRPAVLGLIAAAAWNIGEVALVRPATMAIALLCCLLIARWKVHPVFLVIGSAVAGMLFL